MAAPLDEERWQRLHETRLRGMIDAGDDPGVEGLVEIGYLLARGSKVVITPAGKAAHAEWARLADGTEEHAAARQAYDQFLIFDKQIKQLTTEWQMASAGVRSEGFSAEDVVFDVLDHLAA